VSLQEVLDLWIFFQLHFEHETAHFLNAGLLGAGAHIRQTLGYIL